MSVEQRVIELSRIPEDCLREDPPLPGSCKIEITSRCNQGCEDCAHRLKLRETGDMLPKVYDVCISSIKGIFDSVGLFLLGEPLLHDNLFEMLKGAASLTKMVFLTTNGSLLDTDTVKVMFDRGLMSLKISIDPDNAPVRTDMIYYAAGYAANEYCGQVSCSMIVKGEPSVAQKVWKNRLDTDGISTYYLPLHNCAGVLNNGGRGCPGTWDNSSPLIPCYQLFRGFYVDWRGRNTLCPICHDEKFLNGSLLEYSVEELWHSEFARDLRRQHLSGNIIHPSCRRCLRL